MSKMFQLTPLEEIVALHTEKVVTNKDPQLPYIGLEHIAQGFPKFVGIAESISSISTNSVFAKDDILFGKLRPNLRKSIKAPFKGYCSTDILVLRCFGGIDPGFVGHLFQWEQVFAAATATAAGTKMPRTSWNDLKRFKVFKPPTFAEQSRIAAVLDTVDAAIAQTEAIIAKLKQVRAGLLHDLLTRGLDEQGQFRDAIAHPEQFKNSLLGQIPLDWQVMKLGETSEISSGVTLGRNLEMTSSLELPYLRVANVQDGYLDLTDVKTVRILPEELPRFQLKRGDVLMNEGGDYDKLGRGTVWEEQIVVCLHQNHVFRVRCRPELLNCYFLAAVSSSMIGKRYFLQSSKQSTNLASINSTQLNAFQLPVPQLCEQEAIVRVIQEHEKIISLEEVTLTKLQSLKSALMTDLLTGRVRVPANLNFD